MFTKPLQFRPDLSAGQIFSAFGAKDRAGGGFLFLCVPEQFAAQFSGEQDDPDLALQRYFCPPTLCSLYGYVFDLAHPDSGGSDGFYQ